MTRRPSALKSRMLEYVRQFEQIGEGLIVTSDGRPVLKGRACGRISKRATCHTFRHSFIAPLLADGYDIRTVRADHATEGLFRTGKSKRVPGDVARRALRKLEAIDVATQLSDLRVPPGNRLHALKDDRAGQHSISVNAQWRLCFRSRMAMRMMLNSATITNRSTLA